MSDKITKKMIENRFAWLCDTLGIKVAESFQDVGAWRLDYERIYGGWVIEEILDRGISHPYGHSRMKASEFFECMGFAMRSIQLDRLSGKDSAQYWPDSKTFNTHV